MDDLVEANTGIQEQLFTVITAGVVCQMGNLHAQSQELEDNHQSTLGAGLECNE